MAGFDLLSVVALLEDIPAKGLLRGQVGTIVETLAPGVYEVEFSDDAGRTYGVADLAPAADVAVALTGVTGGQLLPGVLFGSGYAETASLLMSSRQATIRRMTTRHHVVGDPS